MTEHLDVGFVDGTTPGKWLRRWRERHPEIPLVDHPLDERDQLTALDDGRVRLLLGRDLQRTEAMHLIELYVEEMAVAAGLPVPALYVLDREGGINAFAAGYTPGHSVVAVTRGALERLDRDELQGVVAHEPGCRQTRHQARNKAARSVASQENSGSARPKWP